MKGGLRECSIECELNKSNNTTGNNSNKYEKFGPLGMFGKSRRCLHDGMDSSCKRWRKVQNQSSASLMASSAPLRTGEPAAASAASLASPELKRHTITLTRNNNSKIIGSTYLNTISENALKCSIEIYIKKHLDSNKKHLDSNKKHLDSKIAKNRNIIVYVGEKVASPVNTPTYKAEISTYEGSTFKSKENCTITLTPHHTVEKRFKYYNYEYNR
jgi:hypothetical protein